MLADERVASNHAHHAGVLLGEGEQHLDQLFALPVAVGLVGGDLVGLGRKPALDELDQALVHLRLRGEVAVERGLETPSFSASAAVVILSHFGASSICARAFRISSRRSPLARGIEVRLVLTAGFYAAVP